MYQSKHDFIYDSLFDEIKKDKELKDKEVLLGDVFMINDTTVGVAKKKVAFKNLIHYFSNRTKWDQEIIEYLSNRFVALK
jgi:hypothetical protein